MQPSPFVTFEVVAPTGQVIVHNTARLCVRCVLPETFPEIEFDSAGACSYCASEDMPERYTHDSLTSAIEPFLRAGEATRRYDCLALFSGGKDSSRALIELVRTYRLRVLAFTLDNGFVATATHQNMRNVLDRLEVDHVTLRPPSPVMKQMYRVSLTEPFDTGTTKYSTSACGSCISVVLAAACELAAEKRIPLLAGGWSPGQLTNAPVVPGQFLAAVVARHFGPLGEHGGLKDSFKHLSTRGAQLTWPSLFNPLYGTSYSEDRIVASLEEYGWSRPPDTDSCSTNCRLNGYLLVHHLLVHGYHPYVFEFAHHVRAGYIQRAEALEKMSHIRVDVRSIQLIEAELGEAPRLTRSLTAGGTPRSSTR